MEDRSALLRVASLCAKRKVRKRRNPARVLAIVTLGSFRNKQSWERDALIVGGVRGLIYDLLTRNKK